MSIHRPQRFPCSIRPSSTEAVLASFRKLDPRDLVRNPVMFTTGIVALLSTILFCRDIALGIGDHVGVIGQIAAWLWFTVLFANFAEAVAEGRGKAQADSLRKTKTDTVAKKVPSVDATRWQEVTASELRAGDLVVVDAGDIIPGDGDVVAGIATVDESPITGESAPVIRESGGDRSAVTGGTRVASDRIVVRITANPGESFLDRMIALVEGAKRQKTPNEIALTILLVGLTLIFLIVCVSLPAFAIYSGASLPVVFLIALLVTLIPTTIGGLLSAIGIAGMDRLVKFNVIAKSGRAVEAAGDIDVLLLDKTGTITLGNRQATEFIPLPDVNERELAEAAFLASLADETPEGKSIVALAKSRFGLKERDRPGGRPDLHRLFRPHPHERCCDRAGGNRARHQEGCPRRRDQLGGDLAGGGTVQVVPRDITLAVERIGKAGGTPLVVGKNGRLLGAIYLKDIVKPAIRERFATLRKMGIRTVMVTGDNPLTAAAIAAEAGVDDFLAEATPEKKLELIRRSRARAAWSPCAATAPTTLRRWPRPMSAWR